MFSAGIHPTDSISPVSVVRIREAFGPEDAATAPRLFTGCVETR